MSVLPSSSSRRSVRGGPANCGEHLGMVEAHQAHHDRLRHAHCLVCRDAYSTKQGAAILARSVEPRKVYVGESGREGGTRDLEADQGTWRNWRTWQTPSFGIYGHCESMPEAKV